MHHTTSYQRHATFFQFQICVCVYPYHSNGDGDDDRKIFAIFALRSALASGNSIKRMPGVKYSKNSVYYSIDGNLPKPFSRHKISTHQNKLDITNMLVASFPMVCGAAILYIWMTYKAPIYIAVYS